MRSDDDIKRDVESELWWDPEIDTTYLAVTVQEGIVQLTGAVRTHDEQRKAEAAAKRVAGVLRVVSDLKLMDERPDPDIARDIVAELRRTLPTVADHIAVTVHDGWVSLEGEVERNEQREIAEEVIRWVNGVKGVTNAIHLRPKVVSTDIKGGIEAALRRSAAIDAARIAVDVKDGEVTLDGTVRSWAERDEAEHAAWAAPGVVKVDNRLAVTPWAPRPCG